MLPVARDQTQMVVGQVSLLVASIKPSALTVTMEIPCLGLRFDLASEADVSGLTDCNAFA